MQVEALRTRLTPRALKAPLVCCRVFSRRRKSRLPAEIRAALTPDRLGAIARDVLSLGESLFLIEATREGVSLVPVSSSDIAGESAPASWVYRLTVPSPSGGTSRVALYNDLLHFRYSVNKNAPWRGVGPLQRGRSTARLHAESEKTIGDESAGAHGYLLPVPKDGADPTIKNLRADIGGLRGGLALIESVSAGLGTGDPANWNTRSWSHGESALTSRIPW